jgi:hypothetical protein
VCAHRCLHILERRKYVFLVHVKFVWTDIYIHHMQLKICNLFDLLWTQCITWHKGTPDKVMSYFQFCLHQACISVILNWSAGFFSLCSRWLSIFQIMFQTYIIDCSFRKGQKLHYLDIKKSCLTVMFGIM